MVNPKCYVVIEDSCYVLSSFLAAMVVVDGDVKRLICFTLHAATVVLYNDLNRNSQWPRFNLPNTTPTSTASAPCPITITSPSGMTTCLS